MKSKKDKSGSTSKSVSATELKEMFLEKYKERTGNVYLLGLKDKRMPFYHRNVSFAYLDTTNDGIILRLRLSAKNPKLLEMKDLWEKGENKIVVDNWGSNAIDVPINDANKMEEYMSLFKLARYDNCELGHSLFVTESVLSAYE